MYKEKINICNNQKNRIDAIDVAKGIGILCIVFGHAAPDSVLRYILYSFHVPLFFVLSGLTYNNKKNKKSFLVGKIRRLLIPYYIFAIISILIYFIMAKIILLPGDTRIIPNLIGMVYANSNSGYMTWNRPLWFLPCLFITSIIIELFENLLQYLGDKSSEKFRWIFLLFAWGIGIALNDDGTSYYLPFHLESAIFLSGFFEFGIILATVEAKNGLIEKIKAQKIDNWVLLAFALICVGFLACDFNGTTDIRIHRFGNFPVCLILSSLTFSLVMLIASIKFEGIKWLSYVGRSSLAIMLMHKFPILFFQEIVPVVKVFLKNTNSFLGGMCAFGVTMVTVVMCLIAEKIIDALFPWMLGKSREDSYRRGK